MKNLKKSIVIITTIAALAVPMAAKAFLPLAGIAVLVEAAGGTVPFAISAATHAAVIGLITFAAKDNNSSSDLASKPITVQIDPDVPLTTPDGWSNDKTPPPSADKGLVCPPTNVNPGSSCGGACTYTSTMTFVDNGGSQCARYETIADVLFQPNPYGIEPGTSAAGFVDKINSCPPGYSVSGSNCNLTDPEQVKKPEKNKDEIQRVGNEFQRDPQQNPADNNPALVQEAPNRISYTDVNTGEKVTIELNSTTGAATVTQTVPNYGNSTTSQQVTTISGGSGSGSGASVSGQSTSTYPGTGDQMGSTPISNGSGSGGGGSGGGSALCEGCATEETLSNIKDILEGEGAGAESAGEGLAEGFAGTQNGVFNGLGSTMRDMVQNSGLVQAYTEKVLPASPWDMAVGGVSSNCEFAFQLLGKTYDLSVCEAQPYLHNAIAFILFFLTAVGVFNLVTERPEGGG